MKNQSGGGEQPVIQVHTEKVSVPPPEPEQESQEEKQPHPETEQVNRMLVEVSAKTIGKLLALITKIEEMDFDESEVEQLAALWSQFIPSMSPLTTAIVGTGVILVGKIGLYMTLKKGLKKNGDKAAKEQGSEIPKPSAGDMPHPPPELKN